MIGYRLPLPDPLPLKLRATPPPAQGHWTKLVPRQKPQHSVSSKAITARQLQALVRRRMTLGRCDRAPQMPRQVDAELHPKPFHVFDVLVRRDVALSMA